MITKIGKARVTNGQIKKLFTDLPEDLKVRLTNCVDLLLKDSLELSSHAASQVVTKHINPSRDVIKSVELGAYSIIEANIVYRKDLRALIRSDRYYYSQAKKCNVNVCLVISIPDQCIVTVYENNVKDRHKTLDSCRYID